MPDLHARDYKASALEKTASVPSRARNGTPHVDIPVTLRQEARRRQDRRATRSERLANSYGTSLP
jgi:hypothetical protein